MLKTPINGQTRRVTNHLAYFGAKTTLSTRCSLTLLAQTKNLTAQSLCDS